METEPASHKMQGTLWSFLAMEHLHLCSFNVFHSIIMYYVNYISWFIELDDGKIYRKALYLMVKTMVSCRFSLKPIHWHGISLTIHWPNDLKWAMAKSAEELRAQLQPVPQDRSNLLRRHGGIYWIYSFDPSIHDDRVIVILKYIKIC